VSAAIADVWPTWRLCEMHIWCTWFRASATTFKTASSNLCG